MRVDVTEQRKVGVILLAGGRDLLRCIESFAVLPFAKVSIRQIKLDVVGIGIGARGSLEMLNGIIVQAISCEKHAHTSLRAVIAGAELVELSNRPARVLGLADFEIGFGQQVQVGRLVGMLLGLLRELRDIEFSPLLSG